MTPATGVGNPRPQSVCRKFGGISRGANAGRATSSAYSRTRTGSINPRQQPTRVAQQPAQRRPALPACWA